MGDNWLKVFNFRLLLQRLVVDGIVVILNQKMHSSDYPDDYIDIVNEINDFIASLDGVPAEDSQHSFGGGSSLGCGSGSGGSGGGSCSGSGSSNFSSDGGYGGSSSTTAATTGRGGFEYQVPQVTVSQHDSCFSIDSLEHDYEPIENIVIVTPPPTPPRNPTPVLWKSSAAASGGGRRMADGQPKHVKAIYNFKGTNNDEVRFKIYTSKS